MSYLLYLSRIRKDLKTHRYRFLPSSTFVLNERGKTRVITGDQIQDRIVCHAVCDEVVNPSINKYLIFDNGASVKDRGISFTRRRLDYHLRRYYREHGNDGYILLMDFSKYYDNIRHDILIRQFKKYISDPNALEILRKSLSRSEVDVSYMSDEEYFKGTKGVFDSLEYQKIPKSLKTGEKFMPKHMEIGNQLSQSAGVMYRIPLDNFAKIVKEIKYYAGYMDDTYVIHESKEFLERFLNEYAILCKSIGIAINWKKTHIYKLSEKWRFLQVQYSLTDTGRIIRKINPKRITAIRRKMKKLSKILSEKEFTDWYNSWFRNNYKLMSKQQRSNMDELFIFLRKERFSCTQ